MKKLVVLIDVLSLICACGKDDETTAPTNNNDQNIPMLYNIGCAGKITSFNETEDGRYLIILNGISRFKIIQELET